MAPENVTKSLCLVDGSGYIFRAFYALPPMTRPDGTPVNAVYGFLSMLMTLAQEQGCSHIGVIFDAKRHNFRNEIFPAYKQNRRETPPELVPQFPLIRAATDALNILHEEREGFEADDLIAAYAKIATDQGFTVRIVSADKDLMQLIRPGVTLYDPMKKKNVSPEDVLAKFGVTPDRVTDVQALMGDATDNIPGAAGVGPKTAAQLINTFGSLSNLMTRLSDVTSPRWRQLLENSRDNIFLSEKLVRLDDNAPVSPDLERFKSKCPDAAKLEAFLIQNNFKALRNKAARWLEKTSDTGTGASTSAPASQTLTAPSTEMAPTNRPSATLPPEEPLAPSAPVEKDYHLIQTEEALKKWIDEALSRSHVAVDTETTSLNPLEAKLVGFSLCFEEGKACYVPLRHGGEEKAEAPDLFNFTPDTRPVQISVSKALALVKPLLESKTVVKIGHHIKFDMHVFETAFGHPIAWGPLEDTMLQSYVLDGMRHSHKMDDLARLFLNFQTIPYEAVCGKDRKKITFDQVPLDAALAYAAEDADVTFRLFRVLSRRLAEQPDQQRVYDGIDKPLIKILCRMELLGIDVDRDQLGHLSDLFTTKIEALTGEIYALSGEEFNINSPAQLGHILFDKLQLPGGKKSANGKWSTDVGILENLAGEHQNRLAKAVLNYRAFTKLKNTYVDALLTLSRGNRRIHTTFSLTSTNTGRLASSDPNLQNIPIKSDAGKEIRRAFVATPGCSLICADYSQIELRLMAHVADVLLLKHAFQHNEDIHARTASEIFHQPLSAVDADTRRRAKAINFGIIYGISAFGLANNLGISRLEAKNYITAYFEKYPELKRYMDETTAFALENGFVLTPFGRKCFIQGLQTPATKAFALRSAINAPIQGGAADIIKMAMIQVQKKLHERQIPARLLLQVHDELIFEVPDDVVPTAVPLIKHAMEEVVSLSVPLVVEVGTGKNWKEAH